MNNYVVQTNSGLGKGMGKGLTVSVLASKATPEQIEGAARCEFNRMFADLFRKAKEDHEAREAGRQQKYALAPLWAKIIEEKAYSFDVSDHLAKVRGIVTEDMALDLLANSMSDEDILEAIKARRQSNK
jgi:hypothetical protein